MYSFSSKRELRGVIFKSIDREYRPAKGRLRYESAQND